MILTFIVYVRPAGSMYSPSPRYVRHRSNWLKLEIVVNKPIELQSSNALPLPFCLTLLAPLLRLLLFYRLRTRGLWLWNVENRKIGKGRLEIVCARVSVCVCLFTFRVNVFECDFVSTKNYRIVSHREFYRLPAIPMFAFCTLKWDHL